MLNDDQLFRELDAIKQGVQGVNARLDVLNGRTRRLETKVAVMWLLWFLTGTVTMIAANIVVDTITAKVIAALPR